MSHESEWLLSKGQDIAHIGKDTEKREPSGTIGGNVNWCHHHGKQYSGSSKILKLELPYNLVIPLPAVFPNEIEILI